MIKMNIKDIVTGFRSRNGSSHLAHSSGIAQAVICGLKFKLPNFMGATPRGDESYISGRIAHTALENSIDTLIDLWHPSITKERILDTWRPSIDEVYRNEREKANNNPHISNIEEYISEAEVKVQGIATILQKRMVNDPAPQQIITEITICNTYTHHEGRIDAIFEYSNHQETIEWKTYSDGSMSQYDRCQTISNGMLVNHRYGREEDNFTGNILTIITPHGFHQPHPTPKIIQEIRNARDYIIRILNGESIRPKLPYIAVCQSCNYLEACNFYRQRRNNNDNERLLWKRRYKVLKKRENTHINKFLVNNLSLFEARQLGIVDYEYSIEEIGLPINGIHPLILRRIDHSPYHKLYQGDSIKIFAKEKDIPILACKNCSGSIRLEEEDRLIVDVYRGKPHDLQRFPLILLKSDVDLTKRELEAIDFIHRNIDRRQHIAFALLGDKINDIST